MIYAAIPLLLAMWTLWLGRRLATAFLLLGYLSIEGFLKLLSNYNRIVHVGFDIIVLSLAAYLVLQAIMEKRAHLDELPYTKLILTYALWMVLQLLNPFSPGLVQSIASFKVHLTMVPLYFIAATLFRNPDDIVKLLFGLTVMAFVPYGMSLIQYALGPASFLDLSPRFWANISYYHDFRPFGTSAVPGGSSVIAFLVVPLSFVLLSLPQARRMMKPIAALSILLAIGTFVVSGIRQVFLGCLLAIVVMGVLSLSRRSGKVLFVGGFVIVLGVAAYLGVATYLRPMAQEAILRDPRAPQIWRERDVTTRLFTLTQASSYREARANPIDAIVKRATKYPFGAGLGRTGSAAGVFKEQRAMDMTSAQVQSEVGWSDNFFADIIVEGGLPAMVMLTWLMVAMLVNSYRLARVAQDPVIRLTGAAMTGFYFAILVMCYGSSPLLGNPITAYFWFFCGLCAAMQRIEANEARQRQQVEELDRAFGGDIVPGFSR